MKEVLILLGSNRGDRMDYLARGIQMISEQAGKLLKKSSVYETEPWGFDDPTSFLNQVVEIETSLSPGELLEQLLNIETKLGRVRPFSGCGCGVPALPPGSEQPSSDKLGGQGYTGRTIDLDILFFGNKLVFTDSLMIPHPRLHERRFTLVPLNEIAPDFVHPVLKKKVSGLLNECRDQLKVTGFFIIR